MKSTDCGVSEFDREASLMRRPWPTRGCVRHGDEGEGRLKVDTAFRQVTVSVQECTGKHFPFFGSATAQLRPRPHQC
jgi:hypothetical protein